jgi:hypothetical protein
MPLVAGAAQPSQASVSETAAVPFDEKIRVAGHKGSGGFAGWASAMGPDGHRPIY